MMGVRRDLCSHFFSMIPLSGGLEQEQGVSPS